ncbi:DUF7178 family protein [Pseudonocardia sp. CA-142604]|uniref:DUF7178 family protein n=1 Tax=Pseudonocardia sp. CA-142604 TaxID=3240024 RepID=UPI003D90D1B9
MKVENVLDHWYAGSDEERHQGMMWYPRSRAAFSVIADDTDLDLYQVVGLVAVYSPQAPWAASIMTAAMVARSRVPVGAGSGVMANGWTRVRAQRILNGDLYDDVLAGYKSNAFAHLLYYGGDSPEDETAGCSRVCIDRHAYSVLCGARANDAAYGASGLQGRSRYEEAADFYRSAAATLSKREGRRIAPHQVQATTWIVRQRLNEEEGRARGGRGQGTSSAQRALARMQRYVREYHPRAALLIPGSGYSQGEIGP